MKTVDVLAQVVLTPEQVAALFWELDAEQQADFFVALERIAGTNLCFQMAGVVQVIQERADKGEYEAMHGFQTMLSHAQGYAESATDYRCWAAKRYLARVGGAS